ncbi:patatin-like phospholipase family protein [Spartinivicinus poritis]|uniref:Patatin-like phospholipase family protein n=1 Tax=Spartinivicinus poritis TaxID=2994640 RepID=A0ABT5UHJ5_9GAMM|nr:patatin-like phospholipase family protein [Spartinivicinus sp. A2-2]MDE1465859.1 patatin-like phospholipase family protein [Spartinivicinus sp. A2-2]
MTDYRAIVFDGGGVRGLITASWVEELEELLGHPVYNYVNYIAGTSTGSILAAALACGIPAQEVVELYQKYAITIFPEYSRRILSRIKRLFLEGPSAPKYNDKGLTHELKRAFGEKQFGDLKVKTLITSYNVFQREPVIFKSWDSLHAEYPLWEVIKASCSAPVYFPAHLMKLSGYYMPLVDGGVVANNPSACLLADIAKDIRLKTKCLDTSQVILGSFGAGQYTRPISINDSREWGALEWALPIIDVLFDGSSDAISYVCRQMIPENQYYRFQVALDKSCNDLDNASTENLYALLNIAHSYLYGSAQGIKKLKKFANLLQRV